MANWVSVQDGLRIMVNQRSQDAAAPIRSRPIAPSDFDAVAELLSKGFGVRRGREFWLHVLGCLLRRPALEGFPKCGYLLESFGRPVGAVLLIFAIPRTGNNPDAIRANISSWYVEPEFRGYASFLAVQALRHKTVTYLNISPATNTLTTLKAQGYVRYSQGIFVGLPALQRVAGDARIVGPDTEPTARFEPFERNLLVDHVAYGCLSFWCIMPECACPFVFRPRRVKGVLPCAQLVYCRNLSDVVRFAGLIGRYLLRRGYPFVVVDADGPIPGLIGHYFAGWQPKFFKGPERPRLGDLAYTEAAMFGM